jgi:hypothetical protein
MKELEEGKWCMANDLERGLREAEARLRLGDRKGAAAVVRPLTETYRGDARVWLVAAQCVEKPELQLKALEKALALNPDLPEARQLREQLVGQGIKPALQTSEVMALSLSPDGVPAPSASPTAEHDLSQKPPSLPQRPPQTPRLRIVAGMALLAMFVIGVMVVLVEFILPQFDPVVTPFGAVVSTRPARIVVTSEPAFSFVLPAGSQWVYSEADVGAAFLHIASAQSTVSGSINVGFLPDLLSDDTIETIEVEGRQVTLMDGDTTSNNTPAYAVYMTCELENRQISLLASGPRETLLALQSDLLAMLLSVRWES